MNESRVPGRTSYRAVTRRFQFNKRPFTRERLMMKRLISVSLAVLIGFSLLIGSERRAWGYVDPGSGLIALQTFFSVIAAYAYFIRRRIRMFFTRKKDPTDILPVAPKDPREIA
jgi:hypothetical protein